jgi:signal transduction histidine kinase
LESVLINVDDHAPARYARTRILRQAGFVVHDAGTGNEALRLVEEVRPDLILLDVHLPDISGLEVCRMIKEQEQTSSVIVVQISASAVSAPQAASALNCGADTYLIEPVDPDVLVATVRAFLRLRAAERAFARANQELSDKNLELELVNQALRRSNDDLEHFAYIASHDLQEPLRNITTHIQLIERLGAQRFSETEHQLFGVVVDSVRRMSLLIQDVLAYSGIGKQTPDLLPHDLNESVKVALANISDAVTASHAEISIETLPNVVGDRSQLSRVFQNLIGNSIKYHSPGKPPRIEIRAVREDSGHWAIQVRDNGIGIAEEHFRKIFQPFKRLHGQQIPGNGIGLALCRRIVEWHGGRIWVESKEGDGATFWFTLHPA